MGEDEFGALLRALRGEAALTQEELAARSGLSVRTIRDLERGKVARPRRETVRLLAAALDLQETDHDELLRLARQTPPPARDAPVGTDAPAPPAISKPTGPDRPRPTVAPIARPARSPKAKAGGLNAGWIHRRRPTARYALVLTALLLTLTAHSSDPDSLPAAQLRHSQPTTGPADRAAATYPVASYDTHPGDPSTIGADLQILHPVARADALIVTVALTGAGTGPVTVTDTAANHYRAG